MTIKDVNEYSKEEYKLLLRSFLDQGYEFCDFHSYKDQGSLILRHDIDFCLDAALQIAQMNAELDISGTFFFMLSSFSYNLLERETRLQVMAIKKLGQNISLHFDPTAYDDPKIGFAFERKTFEDLTSTPINIFSVHRPGNFLDNPNEIYDQTKHTYMDEYFKNMKYVSDSGGSFKYGHPLELPEFNDRKTIHMLLHPIWWTQSYNSSTERLNLWMDNHVNSFTEKTAKNCKTYTPSSYKKTG